jgi:hypothetical protein
MKEKKNMGMGPQEIAEKIAVLAAELAECSQLDARDRNTAIGMLRNAACFVRGAECFPGFKQAAFAPTTARGPKPQV